MMPSKPVNKDEQFNHGTQSMLQSTVYTQPWWHGAGGNTASGETADKSSQVDGSMTNRAIQSSTNGGLDYGANFNVGVQSDGKNEQEHRHLKVASSETPNMAEHYDPNSQMELVGHSIVEAPSLSTSHIYKFCLQILYLGILAQSDLNQHFQVLTSYPYSDPQYCGILTSYGPHAMVQPQLYGVHHSRMPLPLDIEEEPVYVNVKQYHGILRRRQSRAKAELEKKAIKVRKPYLHESRHQHAMRRARGCGGRFINTKKLDGKNANSTSQQGDEFGSNHSSHSGSSSSSELLYGNGNGNKGQEGKKFITRSPNFRSNGSDLSSMYYPTSSDGKQGDCSSQRMQINGAVPIK